MSYEDGVSIMHEDYIVYIQNEKYLISNRVELESLVMNCQEW